MNKTMKQIALFAMIGLMILIVYNMFNKGKDSTLLNYSDFVRKVANHEIASINIENNKKIRGLFKKNMGKKEDTSIAARLSKKEYDFETIIPYEDPQLIKRLIDSGIRVEGKDEDDNMFLKAIANFLPFLLIFGVIWFFLIRQMQGAGNKALSFGKSKARLNPETQNKITFDDVAGAEEAKEELQEIIEFLMEPKKFINIGARIPTGVLLMGPPGTGKTLLARAIAGEADVPFFSISGSDFVEMFVGVGASRVRDLFEQGKKSAPCIIFIDEIDAVGRLRGAGLGGGHDEREQTLNQLLVEMDGFETNEGVIIVAATNRPDVLDPALLRPGRFDRQIVVDIPDIRGREKILAVHSRKIPLAKGVNLKTIARGTPGFTGADLANLVNEAALLAARRNNKRVSMIEMEDAKDKVMMGPERRSIIISEAEKKITAYHEAGHTLISILTEFEPIHKVTIIPRGRALGLTMPLPTEEKYNHSRAYLMKQIMMLFGGHIAEEVKFNEVTTGSSNDLERASTIARKMICEWGMSEKLGPVAFGQKNEQIFLGREISQHRDYSEATASLIDSEVNVIIDSCRNDARKLLKKNIKKLDALAQNLMERETLNGEDITKILNGETLPPLQNNNGKKKPKKAPARTAAVKNQPGTGEKFLV